MPYGVLMARHLHAVAELDRFEADRLRARALELVAELDTITMPALDGGKAVLGWAGAASVILAELARG